MRWFKKIVRAVLALLPAIIMSLMIVQPSYATSHELKGFRFAYPTFDCGNSDGLPFYGCDGGTPFSISFENDNMFPQTASFYSLFRFNSYYDNGICRYGEYPSNVNVSGNGWNYIASLSNNNSSISLGFPYVSKSILDTNNSARCNKLRPFDSVNSISIESLPDSILLSGLSRRDFYVDHMAPYWYSTDGFYSEEHHINTSTGEAYTSALSLSDFLGAVPNKFTRLVLPLYNSDTDEDCTGSLLDRDVDINGVFRFTDSSSSFYWNQNLSSSSKFAIQANFYHSGSIQSDYFDCTSNLVTVDGYRQLEFTCPLHVDSSDYHDGDIDNVDFALYIEGLDSNEDPIWVWDSSNWTFAGMYVITDNLDTPGCNLHSDLSGKQILGDHTQEDMSEGGSFTNLIGLFNFTFINPLQPIFSLFTDGSSCASIPTLASMLHAEETEVCPWFDSSIRNITTPVLSIFSSMVVFGFAVRWLDSTSGNFTEDGGKK